MPAGKALTMNVQTATQCVSRVLGTYHYLSEKLRFAALSYSILVAVCPFCSIAPEDTWILTEDAVAIPHSNPLTACHIVIAPRRHVAGFYDLDVQEQRAVWNMVGAVRKRIAASLKVDGFDIGFEDGSPDDENPAHALVHVVPRTPGEALQLPVGIDWVDAGLQ